MVEYEPWLALSQCASPTHELCHAGLQKFLGIGPGCLLYLKPGAKHAGVTLHLD